jgi:hypothetical protein
MPIRGSSLYWPKRDAELIALCNLRPPLRNTDIAERMGINVHTIADRRLRLGLPSHTQITQALAANAAPPPTTPDWKRMYLPPNSNEMVDRVRGEIPFGTRTVPLLPSEGGSNEDWLTSASVRGASDVDRHHQAPAGCVPLLVLG